LNDKRSFVDEFNKNTYTMEQKFCQSCGMALTDEIRYEC
jgi:hypothetical protein